MAQDGTGNTEKNESKTLVCPRPIGPGHLIFIGNQLIEATKTNEETNIFLKSLENET